MSQPVSMLVTYIPKEGAEQQLQALVEKHGATLRKLGLITAEPVRLWKASDKRRHGESSHYFVELFQWRDEEASSLAHQLPEVMAIWEPMGPILQDMKLTRLETLA